MTQAALFPDPQQSPAPLADAVAMQEAGVSVRIASDRTPEYTPPALALPVGEANA